MAKKDPKTMLGGFSFKKIPEITDGLIIPTGNNIKQVEPVESTNVMPLTSPPQKPQKPINTPKISPIDIDMEAFEPMTNVVPTIEPIVVPTVEFLTEPKPKRLSRKAKQRITPEDLNLGEIGALATKQEKVSYLAMRGWSLKVERRRNTFYHYATKYIKRKKKRFYIGSINE